MSKIAPQKLPQPKAILFDWDNTLVDTWPIIHEALVETFNHMGAEPWSLAETKRKVGKSLRDHFPSLFGKDWERAGEVYTKSYRNNHLHKLTALPEVNELLDYLESTSLFCAVVSNKQGPVLRMESIHMGWDKRFKKFIGALDAKRDKPFADPALLALEASTIVAGPHVWFVGDSVTDVDCAIAAGFTPIIYANDELATAFPEVYHVKGHNELIDLIKKHI